MSKISPKIDLAFKKIFAVEENKDLLISLINSVVSEEDQVTDITVESPYCSTNSIKQKPSILDLKARGTNGRLFNIEIQVSNEVDYDSRALYYLAKLYSDQQIGDGGYGSLPKCIGIHILNFIWFKDSPDYHHTFQFCEKKKHFAYFRKMEIHTIELKKFSNRVGDKLANVVAQVQTSLDRWAAFLTKHELLDYRYLPENLNDKNLKKALHVLEVINFSKEELDLYEAQLKSVLMENEALKAAKYEGRKEGRDEGKQEKAIMIARNALQAGLSKEFIASLTDLSLEEIEQLMKG